MKKVKLTLISFLITISVFASGQKSKADVVYAELKQMDNVFSMSLSKEMIDFFDLDIDLNGKEKWIKGDFHEGKMLIIKEEIESSKVIHKFIDQGYKQIDLEDEDSDETSDEVYLLVDKKGETVKEAHFVVANEDNLVLLSIYGNIKVEEK